MNIKQKISSTKSPLRYPGGKSRAANKIASFISEDITEIISPFFGGGSVELHLTSRGVKVFGYDIFKPLVEFWQCLLERPQLLSNSVKTHHPLEGKEKFYELQKSQMNFDKKIERAAVYYVLNRSSFSGITLSGGISPDHPRFTLSSIDRVRNFYNPNINVELADFKSSLLKHPNTFAYLDPPYLVKSSLYGEKGNAHKNFDHLALFNILKNRTRWLLSYNDCEEIRKMYNGFRIIKLEWRYGMTSNRKSSEILIFSNDKK